MTRPKVSAKVFAAYQRRKALLEELVECRCLPMLTLIARDDLQFARNQAEAGLIHVGSDWATILPAGRQWLKDNA